MATKKNDDDDDKKAADSPKQRTRDHTPGVIDKDDPYSDVRADDLNEAANTPGAAQRDPVGLVIEPVKVTTMDDLGIGPRDPYPTGNPPPPTDHYGRYVDEDGKVVDARGKLIKEERRDATRAPAA